MVEKFTENTMKIICAIQQHKDKYGNDDAVLKYYEQHGTYSGIVEFLMTFESEHDQ